MKEELIKEFNEEFLPDIKNIGIPKKIINERKKININAKMKLIYIDQMRKHFIHIKQNNYFGSISQQPGIIFRNFICTKTKGFILVFLLDEVDQWIDNFKVNHSYPMESDSFRCFSDMPEKLRNKQRNRNKEIFGKYRDIIISHFKKYSKEILNGPNTLIIEKEYYQSAYGISLKDSFKWYSKHW